MLASTVVVPGHTATFLIAARTVGVTAPVSRLLPLAMVSLMAMVLPNIGGWGPREGVTAWTFSAAGLSAAHGAETAVVYGVLVLAASLRARCCSCRVAPSAGYVGHGEVGLPAAGWDAYLAPPQTVFALTISQVCVAVSSMKKRG